MLQKNHLQCIVSMLLSIFFVACSYNQMETPNSPKIMFRTAQLLDSIPYADSCALALYAYNGCYNDRRVLDYRLARDYSYVELISNIDLYYPARVINDLGLQEIMSHLDKVSLSDRPIIIYDYNEVPFYYEFPILYDDTSIIGTITVNAQPRSRELIEFMFPSPLQYDTYDRTYQRYVGEYPNVYYKTPMGFMKKDYSNSDSIMRSVVNFPLETHYHKLVNRTMEILSTDELDQISEDLNNPDYIVPKEFSFIDLESYLESLSLTAEISSYWDSISAQAVVNNEFQLTDELRLMIRNNIEDTDATEVGFLEEYMNDQLRLTSWADYCGPAALAWIYRGKYDSFNGKYIKVYGNGMDATGYPDFGESSTYAYYYMGDDIRFPNNFNTRKTRSQRTDGGLYYTFFQYCTETFGTYPLYDTGIRRGVAEATNNEYKIKFITAPVSWIRDKHQPVLVEGIGGHAHYWAAIGYGYKVGILNIHYHWRIFVIDNGSYSSAHHHYPYWSKLGGLNYAWEEKS